MWEQLWAQLAWAPCGWVAFSLLSSVPPVPPTSAGPQLCGQKVSLEKICGALATVARWARRRPTNQKVTGSIPGQGTCLGCEFHPRLGHILGWGLKKPQKIFGRGGGQAGSFNWSRLLGFTGKGLGMSSASFQDTENLVPGLGTKPHTPGLLGLSGTPVAGSKGQTPTLLPQILTVPELRRVPDQPGRSATPFPAHTPEDNQPPASRRLDPHKDLHPPAPPCHLPQQH